MRFPESQKQFDFVIQLENLFLVDAQAFCIDRPRPADLIFKLRKSRREFVIRVAKSLPAGQPQGVQNVKILDPKNFVVE